MTPLSVPTAIEPFYSTARVNQPIGLFRGRMNLVSATRTERHRGEIVLDWLPSTNVRTWVRGRESELAIQHMMGAAAVNIEPQTPARTVPPQLKTTRSGSRPDEPFFETGSYLITYECGDHTAELSHGLLHVANFPRLHGRMVRSPDGSIGADRLLFDGGGWTIVLDPVQNRDDLQRHLEKNGGFALTHTASVERISGATFTTAEFQELTEALTFFCWLCTER